MSKRAEEAALKAYPKETRDCTGFVVDIGHPQWMRNYYIQGYEQAEKDTIERAWEWMTSAKGEHAFEDFRKAMEEE